MKVFSKLLLLRRKALSNYKGDSASESEMNRL